MVDFADFIFSSSPYAVVYLIPDQTIAPTAKSAANQNALSAIVMIRSFTHVIQEDPQIGTHIFHSAHPLIKSIAPALSAAGQAANESWNTKKSVHQIIQIRRRIRINLEWNTSKNWYHGICQCYYYQRYWTIAKRSPCVFHTSLISFCCE